MMKMSSDPTARLLEQHRDAILRVCRRVLRHPQDAEDACQEVLLEVHRQAGAVQDPAALPGWIYRTALHTALDLRRKRGRDRLRDARARSSFVPVGPSDELHESLYAGLSRLDDDSRALVVEHYFAERSLRDLAAERGCSQVSIWKRLRSVRERLRTTIGSAAMAALETPGGAGLFGSLGTGAISLKLAIGIPVGLAALVGVMLYARSPEPPPTAVGKLPTTARAPLPKVAPSDPAPRPAPAQARPRAEEKSAPAAVQEPRKPYPYKASNLDASSAAQWTWSLLNTKRVTLDEQGVTLAQAMDVISKETGLKFLVDPGPAEQMIAFKVQSILVDGCLRLLLQPRRADYEIRPDGQIHVGSADQIQGGFERAAREVEAPAQELKLVAHYLDGGWDGVGDPNDWSPKIAVALKRSLTLPQGETTLRKEIARLAATADVQVNVDLPTPITVAGVKAQQGTIDAPFLQPVEERTLGAHLEQLAARAGLVVSPVTDRWFDLTTPEKAAEKRAKADEQKAVLQRGQQVLESALPDGGRFTVQRFAEWVRSTQGVSVTPSEEAWNGATEFSVARGSTLRQGLDALKSQGYRWAISDGKIYILK
jgi:RNA polymerase sigma factor (sigma-70 family)